MTAEEFKTLAKGMKSVYAGANFLPDDVSMQMWYRLLADLDYRRCEAAVLKHMSISRFPPTIADIRGACCAETEERDWLEGWSCVRRAINRWGMYRPDEAIADIRGTDPAAARVASLLGWQALCESENPAADRANFRTCYETQQKRDKEQALLPPAVNKLLADVSGRLMIGDKETKRL